MSKARDLANSDSRISSVSATVAEVSAYATSIVNAKVSVQFATSATTADNAGTLDGIDSTGFVQTTYNSSLNSDSRNSRGVTRLYRRESDTDYSVQTYWTGTRWVLKGYSGDTLHAECEVNYATNAGNADTLDSYHGSNYIGLNGNSYFQLTTWLQSTSTHGFYSPNSGAGTHFYPGSLGDFGSFRVDGKKGGYSGISLEGRVVFMHNGSTSTGIYNDVNNHWLFYAIHGDASYMYHNGSGKIYTYSSGGRVTGNFLASSNVYAYYSDERLKDKDGTIQDALDKIKGIDVFYYYENDLAKELGHDNDRRQLGVSAQQVKAVLPECVALAPFDTEDNNDGTVKSKSGEDYMTVDYPRLVPLLIKAVQELTERVEELEKKNGNNV